MMRKDQESAVSPTIATVLILMMTVVAVAVVAAVAMGLAGGEPDYVVGLTVKAAPAGNDAVVTLYGSRNLPDLVRVEVIDAGSSAGEFVEAWNGTAGTAPAGVPLTAKNAARPADTMHAYTTKLWVKGTFADGTEQVLLMQTVTFTDVKPSGSGDREEEENGPVFQPQKTVKIWDEELFKTGSGGKSYSFGQNELVKFEDNTYIYFYNPSSSSLEWNTPYDQTNTATKFLNKYPEKSTVTNIGDLAQKIQEANKDRKDADSQSKEAGSIYIKTDGTVMAYVQMSQGEYKWHSIGTVSEES